MNKQNKYDFRFIEKKWPSFAKASAVASVLADKLAGRQKYNFQVRERYWQKYWLEKRIYEPNLRTAKKPFYNLMMFPYLSAEGMHVGNMYAFVGSDIYGRFKRMNGSDVFEPIGLDGFGIHSENYALKINKHPMQLVKINEKNFYRQLQMFGNGFSWREKLETYDPNYYQWTQWIFLQLFKNNLAYRRKAPVNWCPNCKTVLADEQVIAGECERCDAKVVKKDLEQWFLRITKYAGRLLNNLDKIDWSEKVKIAQRNWIGKSEGVLIRFPISRTSDVPKLKSILRTSDVQNIEVFTTRPDTIFGATYLVLSPEHTIISNLKSQISNFKEVEKYKKTAVKKQQEIKEKIGIELKGIKAINPATGEKIPVWVADYVLSSVGTGAIMAVPAHDQRDFEFAQRYHLNIHQVIAPLINTDLNIDSRGLLTKAYEDEGFLVDSGKFTGLSSQKAKKEITAFLQGKKVVKYRLRDWLISRQRYWGPPIPLVFCENCKKQAEIFNSPACADLRFAEGFGKARASAGRQFPISKQQLKKFNKGELENPGWIVVPEKDLPVKLPFVKNFKPKGKGESPLASVKSFYETKCPKCGGKARRETDVSDTFLDSAWYYLAYLMKFENWKLEFGNLSFSRLARKWLPVDMYIGGAEHSVLHLLYARFLALALQDIGVLHFSAKGLARGECASDAGSPPEADAPQEHASGGEEPFKKFRAHGLLIKEGAKISKSRGNIINPDEYIREFGADAFRMYLMFLAPFEEGGDFQDRGILGITRFLDRVRKLVSNRRPYKDVDISKKNFRASDVPELNRLLHKTIKKVTEDIEILHYNTAISALMILLNEMEKQDSLSLNTIKSFVKLLAPFAPHLTEELWQYLTRINADSNADKRGISVNQRNNQRKSAFKSIHQEAWPKYNPRLIQENIFEMVVQINGRYRLTLKADKNINQKEAEKLALSNDKIKKFLGNKDVKKVIFVPNRLINFVID